MITCTRCNTTKAEEEFPLSGDGKGGRRKQCKQCMREINKEWRKENKNKVRDYNKGRKKLGA